VRAKYETTGGRLRREIAELESQRKERAAQVKPDLLKRYERIRSRQGNLGMVKITGNTCPGCHVTFPSEVVKALRAGRSELTCESCGRLLFWEQ
jgi:predicted  nucleic acid-binding Zn-ribbon protein